MNIEKEYLEDHQVKLTVEVNQDRMESAKRRAARNLARSMKIPGFRPGKAPYNVIVRYAGEGAVIEEGLEILVSDIYPEVIEEAEITPFGPGTLENVESIDPPILEFLIPLEAEVELGDYLSIRRTYEPDEITDSQIDDVLENLREQQAIIEQVDRAAEPTDIVTVLLNAKEINGEESDAQVLIEERSIPFLINGDNLDENEWPFSGFSSNLIGMSKGDSKKIIHEFPDDAFDPALQGNKAELSFEVEMVRSRTLPDLDEEFLKTIGDHDDFNNLRDDIRDSLESQTYERYNEEYDELILEELIDSSSIKYPPQMLENQLDNVINNLELNLQQQNLDMELYLKSRQQTSEELREELQPVAEARLSRTLVLMEIAKEENIQVAPEQLETETRLAIESIKRQAEPNGDSLTNSEINNIATNVFASFLVNLAMDRFRDIAKGELDSVENDTDDVKIDEAKDLASDDPELSDTEPELEPETDASDVNEDSKQENHDEEYNQDTEEIESGDVE